MKNLLIILSFVFTIVGCFLPRKASYIIPTEETELFFINSDSDQRWVNDHWLVIPKYVYRTKDGAVRYSFQHWQGQHFIYNVQR